MTTHGDLRVAAPDAPRGSTLAQRLSGSELAGSDTDGWWVVGQAANLTHVLGTIQQWLRDESIEHTTVHVGDHIHTMTAA